MFLVMVEVVLVIVTPTYTPRKLILAETGIMRVLGNLRVIEQDAPRYNNPVRIIQLVLLVVLHLVLMPVMVKVVWILGTPTLPTKNWIVGLMVVILCHLWVGIIQQWAIPTNLGNIINHLWVGRINLSLIVMEETMLELIKPTSPPKHLILTDIEMMRV